MVGAGGLQENQAGMNWMKLMRISFTLCMSRDFDNSHAATLEMSLLGRYDNRNVPNLEVSTGARLEGRDEQQELRRAE